MPSLSARTSIIVTILFPSSEPTPSRVIPTPTDLLKGTIDAVDHVGRDYVASLHVEKVPGRDDRVECFQLQYYTGEYSPWWRYVHFKPDDAMVASDASTPASSLIEILVAYLAENDETETQRYTFQPRASQLETNLTPIAEPVQ
jgi:hypothetical protein